MSMLLIWMDTVEAKLFEVSHDTINTEKVLFHGHKHPKETLGKNHTRSQSDEEVFYRQLAQNSKLRESEKILLMGPSVGAHHFSSFLEVSAPEIYHKIIGIEKVARMPDSEILSTGQKYLQRYFLYNAV